MLALPAIDLRDGACVQLVGGDYAAERFRRADPVGQARDFLAMGFRSLHVVDLDAATGRGDNSATVNALLALPGLSVQVGGGIRSPERARALLAAGAKRVVVGTRAVEDRAFLRQLVGAHPGAITVAVDVRGREVLLRGWQAGSGRDVVELVRELTELPLAGLLVTAVHLEGQLAGIDAPLYEALVAATALPIVASGGVSNRADLVRLADIGCAAAVIGMALYKGGLDGPATAREFAE